ncbi:MAG: formate/nitrite transporter family protein [Syntrophomonadales bacterium]
MIILGILAGAYIGFGANLATVVGADGGSKFLFGAVFSVGLMMVVIGGAELFTGNNMFLTICALNGQTTWGKLLYNWVVVYFANFAGSLTAGFHNLQRHVLDWDQRRGRPGIICHWREGGFYCSGETDLDLVFSLLPCNLL